MLTAFIQKLIAECLPKTWNKIHFSRELDGDWLVGMPE